MFAVLVECCRLGWTVVDEFPIVVFSLYVVVVEDFDDDVDDDDADDADDADDDNDDGFVVFMVVVGDEVLDLEIVDLFIVAVSLFSFVVIDGDDVNGDADAVDVSLTTGFVSGEEKEGE